MSGYESVDPEQRRRSSGYRDTGAQPEDIVHSIEDSTALSSFSNRAAGSSPGTHGNGKVHSERMLHLQRSFGNRAVQRMVQRQAKSIPMSGRTVPVQRGGVMKNMGGAFKGIAGAGRRAASAGGEIGEELWNRRPSGLGDALNPMGGIAGGLGAGLAGLMDAPGALQEGLMDLAPW